VSLTRYATVVSAVVILLFGAAVLVFGEGLDAAARSAVLLAGLLAGANAVTAYFLATWAAATRSNALFMQAILGGMLGRMVVLLAAVVLAIVVFELPRVPLIASLLTHFVVFLILEVAVLSRRVAVPGEAR
jgi:hypothetical protein